MNKTDLLIQILYRCVCLAKSEMEKHLGCGKKDAGR